MALTPGCADTHAETTPEVQVSSPTLAALSAFSQQGAAGGSLRLAEATPFAWDTVWFFMDGSATGDEAVPSAKDEVKEEQGGQDPRRD